MFNENILRVLQIIAGILSLVGLVPYVWAVLRDRKKINGAKPSKATWIIWASLDTITLAGMVAEKSVNGQIVGAVMGAWVVAILALKYGIPGWSGLDKFCLGGALLGISLWYWFSNPVLGIVTSMSVVFLGSFPTFVSAWRDPSREDKTAWIIGWSSCVFVIMAIPRVAFADVMQPITFFVIESVMVLLVWVKPWLRPVRFSPADA